MLNYGHVVNCLKIREQILKCLNIIMFYSHNTCIAHSKAYNLQSNNTVSLRGILYHRYYCLLNTQSTLLVTHILVMNITASEYLVRIFGIN